MRNQADRAAEKMSASPSPIVDRAVLDAATWEANNACINANKKRDKDGDPYLTPADVVDIAVETAAPLIVKAERDRIREGIEGLRYQTYYLSGVNYSNPSEVQQATLDAVLALLDEEARNG